MKKMTKILAVTAALMVGSFVTTLYAQTMINIDLGAGTSVGSGTAGVVSSDGWQQESGFPDFGPNSLDYEDGSASGATVTLGNASGNVTSIGAATTDGNYEMYNRGAGIKEGSATTLSLSGLDTSGVFSGGYDVYVYMASAVNFDAGDNVNTFRVGNGTTDYFLDLDETVTSYAGSFVQSSATIAGDSIIANYVKFSGMSGASFTVDSINTEGKSDSAGLFTGMQVVAIPEPSTLALVGIALGAVMLFRRRR